MPLYYSVIMCVIKSGISYSRRGRGDWKEEEKEREKSWRRQGIILSEYGWLDFF